MDDTTGHDLARPDFARPDFARTARLLLCGSRAATLATAAAGQPFASLVTPAVAPDGSVLLLLSDLSEHTRHLRQDGRCSVLATGARHGPNAQTTPRVTVTGTAVLDADPALHARWVAVHPYAAFYAGFGDFNLWRLRPEGGLLVAGFARAHRLDAAAFTVPPMARQAVAAAEPGVMQHCNADHGPALDAIAAAAGQGGTGWRMIGCGVDGFDLAREDTTLHLAWPSPVDGPGAIRTALVHLAGAAKNRVITAD